MARRVLLLLAATWTQAVGGFAQESPRPQSDSNADRDSAVLEVVLKDLLSWPESPFRPRDATKKQILFSPEALTGRLTVADVLQRHDPRGWQKMSPVQIVLASEAARHLARRLDAKDTLKGLKLKDERIAIWAKAGADAKRDRPSRRARPQVFRAYAPGYSHDRQVAIVRLAYPWSIHSGYATYVLARKENEWVILVRDFVIDL
jgi:hypothetical protein